MRVNSGGLQHPHKEFIRHGHLLNHKSCFLWRGWHAPFVAITQPEHVGKIVNQSVNTFRTRLRILGAPMPPEFLGKLKTLCIWIPAGVIGRTAI